MSTTLTASTLAKASASTMDGTEVFRLIQGGVAVKIAASALAAYIVGSAAMTSTLSSYVTSLSLTSTLSSYVTSASLTSTLTGYVTPSASQTLTNKTISGASNTLSNIGNGALSNSSVTIGSTSVSLGATVSTFAGVTLTSPTFTSPALGTPASGSLTNCTGLPISGGVAGLGTGISAWLATPSSANLFSALTDKTGSGVNVFGTAPTITTSLTINEGAGSSALTLTGATQTTSAPVLNATQTWNAGAQTFTGLKLNVTDTASAAGSLLLDLQVGGGSVFSVTKAGRTSCLISNKTGTSGTGEVSIWDNSSFSNRKAGLINSFGGFSNGVGLASDNVLLWDSGTNLGGGTQDLVVRRDAANTLALQNGTNAQTFNVYNTSSSANANFERMGITWSSNVCYMKTSNAGTGSARLFVPVTGSTTVASLPSASTAGAGARSFVTDASATTYLSTVSGGGANKVPVVSDGTNWLIG